MFDLTDIGNNKKEKVTREKISDTEVIVNGHKIKTKSSAPENPLWTIDKAIEDGQYKAGEVDKNHSEFLKTTEFVE